MAGPTRNPERGKVLGYHIRARSKPRSQRGSGGAKSLSRKARAGDRLRNRVGGVDGSLGVYWLFSSRRKRGGSPLRSRPYMPGYPVGSHLRGPGRSWRSLSHLPYGHPTTRRSAAEASYRGGPTRVKLRGMGGKRVLDWATIRVDRGQNGRALPNFRVLNHEGKPGFLLF